MSNNRSSNSKAFLIAGLIIALGAVVLFFFASKRFNWNETYQESASVPYGASLLSELVEASLPQESRFIRVNDTLRTSVNLDDLAPQSTYLYIGREYYADSADIAFIATLLEHGHRAIIISHTFNRRLLTTFLDHFDDEDEWMPWGVTPTELFRSNDSAAVLSLLSAPEASFEIKHIYDHKVSNRVWVTFPLGLVTHDGYDVLYLGDAEHHGANFIRIASDQGDLYLHSTPIAFSNFWLRTPEGFRYASEALAVRGNGDVIWDAYNRDFRFTKGDFTPQRYSHEDGFLSFLLANRGLRASWFILLALAALFLAFGGRRNQRPVAVLSPLRNTSLNFAETIGTMYRLENEHKKLTSLKMRLFKAHVRERYNLSTRLMTEDREAFIAKLAERSHSEPQVIRDVLEIYDIIEGRNDPDGAKLVRLHNAIEKFLSHAR